MSAANSDAKKITRSMSAKRDRRSIVKIPMVDGSEVLVEIVPVSCGGHAGFDVTMPAGGKIEHVKIEKPVA